MGFWYTKHFIEINATQFHQIVIFWSCAIKNLNAKFNNDLFDEY